MRGKWFLRWFMTRDWRCHLRYSSIIRPCSLPFYFFVMASSHLWENLYLNCLDVFGKRRKAMPGHWFLPCFRRALLKISYSLVWHNLPLFPLRTVFTQSFWRCDRAWWTIRHCLALKTISQVERLQKTIVCYHASWWRPWGSQSRYSSITRPCIGTHCAPIEVNAVSAQMSQDRAHIFLCSRSW